MGGSQWRAKETYADEVVNQKLGITITQKQLDMLNGEVDLGVRTNVIFATDGMLAEKMAANYKPFVHTSNRGTDDPYYGVITLGYDRLLLQ